MIRNLNMPALAVLVLVFAILAASVSPGFFTIDEFIVYSGAQAMLDHGSFAVANGAEGLSSQQLRLIILVEGEHGLVPQYPPGPAILGALLMGIFGLRGLILLNALASFASVIVLYFMTRRHFGGEQVALLACGLLLFASFFFEYAFAVWPHACSVLAVLVACWFALEILQSDDFRPALCVGLGAALGVGLFFRADVVLAGAGLGFGLFLLLDKPYKSLFAIGLGGAPFALAMGLVNAIKFGTFNPLSYGQTHGGATNLASHGMAVAALGAAVIVGMSAKTLWRHEDYRKPMMLGGLLVAAILLAIMHGFVLRYLNGFWGLIVDATTINDPRPGVVAHGDGTVLFWGLTKKALGQSLPWLALIIPALASTQVASLRHRVLIGLLFAIWSLPFFPKEWHGGMGSNMRYFLPLLPIFCALSAGILVVLWRAVDQARQWVLVGAVIGVGAHAVWKQFHPTGLAGAHQSLSTWLFLAVAVAACLYTFGPREWKMQKALLTLAASGIALSSVLSYDDFRIGQNERQRAAFFSQAHVSVPDDTLMFVPARFSVGWALQEGHVLALPDDRSGDLDTGLIDAALERGMRVLVWPRYVNAKIDDDPRYALKQTNLGRETHRLIEVTKARDNQELREP